MTLARIARQLGLSTTTVSRALAGYEEVAAATRARVEQEAARINYQPNQLARQLRGGRSGAVGLVLPTAPGHFDDPFFLRMLAAVGQHLAAANLELLVTAAPPGAEELRAYQQLAEVRRVEGMLIFRTRRRDARISYLLDRGTPFVVHGRTMEQRPYAYLDLDGAVAFRTATERLIGLGHTRIGLINASATYMFARYRRAGWHDALHHAGLADGPVDQTEPTEENGFRITQAMLARDDPPTAILCATDRIAVGALQAIKHVGLRAGHDVSVIGHDDLPLASYTDPPLTTMGQPIERAAARMVEMLLGVIGGADPADFAELWPAPLIVRASDGPAPTSAADETRGAQRNHPGETHVSKPPPHG